MTNLGYTALNLINIATGIVVGKKVHDATQSKVAAVATGLCTNSGMAFIEGAIISIHESNKAFREMQKQVDTAINQFKEDTDRMVSDFLDHLHSCG